MTEISVTRTFESAADYEEEFKWQIECREKADQYDELYTWAKALNKHSNNDKDIEFSDRLLSKMSEISNW